MKKIIILLLGCLFMLDLSFATDAPSSIFSNRKEVKRFIHEMHIKHGIDKKKLSAIFSQFRSEKKVLDLMSKQYEALPWYQYRERMITQKRINSGVIFWKKNNHALKKIEKQFGIPPQIIVGILGIESCYGEILGHYPVLQTLSTLAFDYPRRASFFKKELEEFLLLTEEGAFDPVSTEGSFAGAMGMPQFMPSSYRRYAIDFSGKGKRDLIDNTDDVIASVANYLHQNGWRPRENIILLPNDQKTKQALSIFSENRDIGSSTALPDRLKSAFIRRAQAKHKKIKVIVLQNSLHTKRRCIGLTNFYTIMRYNNSVHYAMAVHDLGEQIQNAYHGRKTK